MIIGILFFIVISFLLAKAIIETIWGTCLIIQSLFWHTVAFLLYALSVPYGACMKLIGKFRKKTNQHQDA